jgi:transcriptional regulator with XRE-family HTH domain
MMRPHKNYLRSCRKKLGLTQGQLASIVGFSSAYRVWKLESGRAIPTFREALALAVICERSSGDLWPRIALDVEVMLDNNIQHFLATLLRHTIRSERDKARVRLVHDKLLNIAEDLSIDNDDNSR